MATVISVNISEKKGTIKHPVPSIQLKLRHGIVGEFFAKISSKLLIYIDKKPLKY